MLCRVTALILMSGLLLTAVQAAQLNVEGTVLVNKGDGFRPVPSGTEVNAGDRVRVVQGSARIVYANCYAVSLQTGQMALVLSNPPAGNCGLLSTGGSLKDVPVDNTYLFVGGALAVGGGIGLTLLLLHNDPVCP